MATATMQESSESSAAAFRGQVVGDLLSRQPRTSPGGGFPHLLGWRRSESASQSGCPRLTSPQRSPDESSPSYSTSSPTWLPYSVQYDSTASSFHLDTNFRNIHQYLSWSATQPCQRPCTLQLRRDRFRLASIHLHSTDLLTANPTRTARGTRRYSTPVRCSRTV